MDAIILAAGVSSRFGGNKLLEKFNGFTLLEYAFTFCINNNVKNIYITISRDETYIVEDEFRNKVLDESNFWVYLPYFNSIQFKFQDKDKYGPAAAIMPWANAVKDDFYVLLGDNYLRGIIHETIKEKLKPNTSIIGYIEKSEDEDNLRLGFINSETKKVKEKPHGQKSGKYFAGFCALSNDTLKKLKTLKLSERGEYEITDLMNSNDNVELFNVSTIRWKDVTYSREIEEMNEFIKKAQS